MGHGKLPILICNQEYYRLEMFFFQKPYSGTWTRTREPKPVLGKLYVLKLFIVDPHLGIWTHTLEPGPVLGNFSPFFFKPVLGTPKFMY